MQFLQNFEDGLDEMFQQPKMCKFLSSILHVSDHGCCILETGDGRVFHAFKKLPITLAMDGVPVHSIYEQQPPNRVYTMTPYKNNAGYFRLLTEITAEHAGYFTSLCDTRDELMHALQRHLTKYIICDLPKLTGVAVTTEEEGQTAADGGMGNGRRNLLTREHQTEPTAAVKYLRKLNLDTCPNLNPFCLFDLAMLAFSDGETTARYLRPTTLTSTFPEFLHLYRAVLFEVIRQYAESDECLDEYNMMAKSVRDRSVCSARVFTEKRNITPELKCLSSTAASCPHIQAHMQSGRLSLFKPEKICHFLVDKLLDDYDETEINTVLGFKCCFQEDSPLPGNDANASKLANVHMAKLRVFACTKLIGRRVKIHRLCLPSEYLTAEWYLWTLSILGV